jgi:hypothetical protein
MNGVNLKATGGLRVMNGAMNQWRSIKIFRSRLPHKTAHRQRAIEIYAASHHHDR